MEEWKDISGYEGKYQVSNTGRIKSLKDNHGNYREKILKPGKHRDNYLMVVLCKDGKEKTYSVHRLVAETFIPKIDGKTHVDHIDGNRQNNNVNNLRWCTHKENCNFELCKKHRAEARKGKTGALNPTSKPVLCIEMNKIFGSTREVERELKINDSSIGKCCNGKYKYAGKHPVTGEKLHWKYIELLPCYNEEVIQ